MGRVRRTKENPQGLTPEEIEIQRLAGVHIERQWRLGVRILTVTDVVSDTGADPDFIEEQFNRIAAAGRGVIRAYAYRSLALARD